MNGIDLLGEKKNNKQLVVNRKAFMCLCVFVKQNNKKKNEEKKTECYI